MRDGDIKKYERRVVFGSGELFGVWRIDLNDQGAPDKQEAQRIEQLTGESTAWRCGDRIMTRITCPYRSNAKWSSRESCSTSCAFFHVEQCGVGTKAAKCGDHVIGFIDDEDGTA
ncbi:hypothetical protein STSP2_03141 [Anaerohalosphaera lusitana]|uniref:Uncharacterized protein n=1 Tax=Anaerohalosphaera lusitana TaxID=1936003 RepID=A0A1U9NPT9_9BACT|nr:hypothetical protein [Anaerohalosphaera lusitana]AQT69941.1 hypothetical protein STSP2_03141 [Anaerohalosphaera lusitana]